MFQYILGIFYSIQMDTNSQNKHIYLGLLRKQFNITNYCSFKDGSNVAVPQIFKLARKHLSVLWRVSDRLNSQEVIECFGRRTDKPK